MNPEIEAILAAFPIGTASSTEPYGKGRLHSTYHVRTADGEYILQKIGPLFNPAMKDIDSVTKHLEAKGIGTARVIPTREGALSYGKDGGYWRLMTFIPGATIEGNPSVPQAENASAFIGMFHTALLDYEKSFAYHLPGYRDTPLAISHLREADAAHETSEKYAVCHPLVVEILGRAKKLSAEIATLPKRTLHGDLKLNNLRFDADGTHAIALIDFDTLGRYTLPLEIGDMLRSWCTTPSYTLDLSVWQTSIRGYRSEAHFVTADEWRLIPDGLAEITLSLAARYCADAYEEKYFAHDPAYVSLFEQNAERTKRYLAVLTDFDRNEESIRTMHA